MIAQESVDMAKLLRERLITELGLDPVRLSQEQIDWLLSVIKEHREEI